MNFGLKVKIIISKPNSNQLKYTGIDTTILFTKASHNFITFIDNILSDSFFISRAETLKSENVQFTQWASYTGIIFTAQNKINLHYL